MDRRKFLQKGLLAVLGTGLASRTVLFPRNLAHAAVKKGENPMKILVLTEVPVKMAIPICWQIILSKEPQAGA